MNEARLSPSLTSSSSGSSQQAYSHQPTLFSSLQPRSSIFGRFRICILKKYNMGKALSKCCPVGRRRKRAAPEEGDTPQIVPVDDLSEDQKEAPVEQKEQAADKPEADSSEKPQEANKPDSEPIVVQEQAATEQTPAAEEEKPAAPEQDAEEEVTVRTIVTEKVIEEPKSTPVIIDTTKSVETKTQVEGEDVSTSEVTSSESRSSHSTHVVKTVVTETVIREGGDGAEESTVTTTETVTENVVVEEGDANKTETTES